MPPKQLVQLLCSQIIPWAAPDRNTAVIVARAVMPAADLPDGVTLSHRKITGKRVVIKKQRIYGNQRYRIAEWPEANLQELAMPKLDCVVSGAADYLLGDQGALWGDDCVKIFLDPTHSGAWMYHWIVNPNGALWEGLQTGNNGAPLFKSDATSAAHIDSNQWTCVPSLPNTI